MKARGIRTSDALWEKVTSEASRRGVSVNEMVNWVLYDTFSESLRCFHCGAPAVHESGTNLTSGRPDSDPLEGLTRGNDGEAVFPPDSHTPIRVTVYTCDEHYDPMTAYFLHRGYSVGGRRLVPEISDCPDPFHTGDSDGEAHYVGPIGGGWTEIAYRCPTCKESTGSIENVAEDASVTAQLTKAFAPFTEVRD